MLRILVVEGNTAQARARYAASAGMTAGEAYAAVLRSIAPDAVTQICFPADADAGLPDRAGLAGYDGVVITGSALHVWQGEPAALRQVELARAVFRTGVPFFGSCWGLQVAAVAAGGAVTPNPNGREIGVSRKITLTEAGRTHPLHRGRPLAFDAPTVHLDAITTLPPDITVTAANAATEVQAAEIRYEGGAFWGVQYHPEYSLAEIAATLTRYGGRLVEEGYYVSIAELEAHAAALASLHADPAQPGLAWRLGLDADLLRADRRLTEIANWLELTVRPAQSRRSRA